MNRQEKQILLNSLKDAFKKSDSSFVVNTHGMSVSALQSLRKSLMANEAKLKVAKNTIFRLAVQDTNHAKDLEPFFKEQVAVVFSAKDPSSIAKVLLTATKDGGKLKFVGARINDKILQKSQVEFLASLPSLDVLRAQLCGLLNTPAVRLVSVLNQAVLKLNENKSE